MQVAAGPVAGSTPAQLWVRVLLAGAAALTLVSFGGQIVLAPLLIPALWMVARRSGTAGRLGFGALAVLLAAEFAWIIGYWIGGESVAAGGGFVGGGATLWGFLSTVRPGPAVDRQSATSSSTTRSR